MLTHSHFIWQHEPCLYGAAGRAGDGTAWADALARATGTRPGPETAVIAIRVRPDGPS